MAIYRPPKSRWPLAIATAIAGLLIGLLTGVAVGRDEFDPAEAANGIKAILTSAAGSLEVAAVEYTESVADGEVIKEAEFDGAMAALASSRSRFSEVRPALETLFPALIDPIEDLYDRAEQAMDARDDPESVTPLLERLEASLKGEIAP